MSNVSIVRRSYDAFARFRQFLDTHGRVEELAALAVDMSATGV